MERKRVSGRVHSQVRHEGQLRVGECDQVGGHSSRDGRGKHVSRHGRKAAAERGMSQDTERNRVVNRHSSYSPSGDHRGRTSQDWHACLFCCTASQDMKTWWDPTNHRIFEQSTTDVWKSVCGAVRQVVALSRVLPKHVKGISFDATCSLVVTNWEGEPIVITHGAQLGELGERNIMLWADHRAKKEADVTFSCLTLFFLRTTPCYVIPFLSS